MRQRAIACALVALTALATAAIASETITYVYDAKGRLIEVRRSGSVNDKVKTVYTYDKVHNRTRVTTTLPPP
jgi:RHS Repeat